MLTNKGFLWPESVLARLPAVRVLLLSFFITSGPILAGPADFNIDGVFEASLDLPRILFLLKTPPPAGFAEPSVAGPNGPALEYMGNFEINWAFLDTGASGILLSRETIEYLQISVDPTLMLASAESNSLMSLFLYILAQPLMMTPTPLTKSTIFSQDPGGFRSHKIMPAHGRMNQSTCSECR